MSRKAILTIVAVLGAVLGVFKTTFGLTIDSGTMLAGVGAILLYVFFEAKADKDRLRDQAGKWKDPKWIITVLSAALVAFQQSTGMALPVDAIVAILTVIVSVLFKVQTA